MESPQLVFDGKHQAFRQWIAEYADESSHSACIYRFRPQMIKLIHSKARAANLPDAYPLDILHQSRCRLLGTKASCDETEGGTFAKPINLVITNEAAWKPLGESKVDAKHHFARNLHTTSIFFLIGRLTRCPRGSHSVFH